MISSSLRNHGELCTILNLPQDILIQIFSLCSALDLARIARVAKGFSSLSHSNELWLPLYLQTWKLQCTRTFPSQAISPGCFYHASSSSASTNKKKRRLELKNIHPLGKLKKRFIRKYYNEVEDIGFSRLDALKLIEAIKIQVESLFSPQKLVNCDINAATLLHHIFTILAETSKLFATLFRAIYQTFVKQQQKSFDVFESIIKLGKESNEASENQLVLSGDTGYLVSAYDVRVSWSIPTCLQHVRDQLTWLNATLASMIQSWKTMQHVYSEMIVQPQLSHCSEQANQMLDSLKQIGDTYQKTKVLFDSAPLLSL